MGLELYAKIEPLLGFEEQKRSLYQTFLEKLHLLGVEKVLDIGCGSGQFMELAQAQGLKIEGVDLSVTMVERARGKGLECYHKDICEVQERYEAAVAVFDVLNYLPRGELKRFLNCVRDLLHEGGYFVADINTLYGFEEVAQGSLWIDADNEFVAVEAEFENGELQTDIIYFYENRGCFHKEKDRIVQYYHEVEVLKVEGLEIVDIDFLSLFGEEADKALLTYKKV